LLLLVILLLLVLLPLLLLLPPPPLDDRRFTGPLLRTYCFRSLCFFELQLLHQSCSLFSMKVLHIVQLLLLLLVILQHSALAAFIIESTGCSNSGKIKFIFSTLKPYAIMQAHATHRSPLSDCFHDTTCKAV
jgi:hypothetical protein